MPKQKNSVLSRLPSVDRVLGWPHIGTLCVQNGRALVTEAVRAVLDDVRTEMRESDAGSNQKFSEAHIFEGVERRVALWLTPSLRPVFNLTGTVLHTNLGRALLPEEAIEAMAMAARQASNLEYDIRSGKRGERNSHIDGWVKRLTGADAAVVVNNNAAAVLLVLNTFARRREVPVSRGELIEIGGAFRLPEIMARAGCKLVEIGTTNRTHLKDYRGAITDKTALLMKVHTSNYAVSGFTASVAERQLADLGRDSDIPVVTDLGSGSLVDLTYYGLPDEPTVAGMIEAGVDLVTFSGDKLLGGPQAGIIAGRGDLIARIKKNPLLRALRCDKVTLSALNAVLTMYARPEKLIEKLPTLRLLGRSADDIECVARQVLSAVRRAVGDKYDVDVAACRSQIGSGAMPVDRLESTALRLRSTGASRGSGRALNQLAARLRALPIPVIGRINDDALWLDLRCLEGVDEFLAQIEHLESS